MDEALSGLVPKPIAWGRYENEGKEVHFFVGAFRDMDFSSAPEPAEFMAKIAQIHQNGTSPNGMFGYPVPTVIPRLLGVLQSDGRDIQAALVHGDLWERNVGIDIETGEAVVFDPGCTYAHNEMEFGTWRCTWPFYFNCPVYTRMYQKHIEPSEPAEEWDDRNRLYSTHQYLTDSAGHPGSGSR
ncbi:hypothetical protein F5Y03DRAFT_391609 [Xylaria venustula]|nr:hypothetical protein F5Y03DRAFT_391609 [Xylaria venustula]